MLQFPPKMTAWAVNQAVGPAQRVNIGKIYASLEQKRGLCVKASHTGVEVWRGKELVYQDGQYQAIKAIGQQQCAEYRLRQLKFLKWALDTVPTSELTDIGGWINAQIS